MECDICMEMFDQKERVPKIVPCGHTMCLECLVKNKKRECPTCRAPFNATPKCLPNNYNLLRLLDCQCSQGEKTSYWCLECHIAATVECKVADHDILPLKQALRCRLQGVLPRAAAQLEALEDKCSSSQALQALTLLSSRSWDVTLEGEGGGEGRKLKGTVWNNDKEPLIEAMWLAMSTSTVFNGLPNIQFLKELNVDFLSPFGPKEKKVEKATSLRSAEGVFRLSGLKSDLDPVWGLQLLQTASPALVQLEVLCRYQAQLQVIHAMPKLRSLFMICDDTFDIRGSQLALPALPPGYGGLQWLTVMMPSPTLLRTLLAPHQDSLEVLQLKVGTGHKTENRWPLACSDLHTVIEKCGLRALRKLLLVRDMMCHMTAGCKKQRAAVQRVVPAGAVVLCDECDGVAEEVFPGDNFTVSKTMLP